MNDIRKIEPLNYTGFSSSIGPGYKRGWYAPRDMGGRASNCVPDNNRRNKKNMKMRYESVIDKLSSNADINDLHDIFEIEYHGQGHMKIAENCVTDDKPKSTRDIDWTGPMMSEIASAHDPIFYRWHQHIDDIAQEFYDREPR